jgi:ParB/RepB/Spo0J family partition protein
MTTEVEVKPEVLDARMLAVKDVVESPVNPRHVRNEAAMLELTASVREVGVCEPVIVRPHPKKKGKWELLAGSRRLEASRRAKRAEIPAVVRDLDDEQAFRITVIENLQREDLTPFEQSEAIRAMQGKGWEIETIAAQLGKSPSWVARRAALGNLTPAWQAALLCEPPPKSSVDAMRAKLLAHVLEYPGDFAPDERDGLAEADADEIEEIYEALFGDLDAPGSATPGNRLHSEHLAEWPVGHLELIARNEPEVQAKVLEPHARRWMSDDIPTRAALEKEISGHLRKLATAQWSPKDAELIAEAGACAECTKRSAARPLLFAELQGDAAGDRCLDPSCWERKQQAWVERKAAEIREAHGKDVKIVLVKDQYNSRVPKLAGKSQVVENYQVKKCKRNVEGARPCLRVDGAGAGEVFYALTNRQMASRLPSSPGPTPLSARREQLEAKRAKRFIEIVVTALHDDEKPRSCAELVRLAATFGTMQPGGRMTPETWEAFEKEADRGEECVEARAMLWARIKPELRSRVKFYDVRGASSRLPEARDLAAYLGVDGKGLWKRVCDEIPEPKGWAKLNADGTPRGPAASAGGKPSTRMAGKSTAPAKSLGRKGKAPTRNEEP